ncbi:hypothetical protein EMCG_03311 [[Emmonsia] crescens]|uniref:Uncharacterized protein n=1 Tax=[Emmonsia] crescens TaxID=73230 RepID=A0A0G2HVS3_9EURO|nr:hypothetical protein EMCG_03311 [Emmonsia crescens UAMH 3008]
MEGERNFTKGLPSGTREYNYLGFEHMKEVLRQDGGLFTIFKNVTPEEIEKHQDFPGRLDYSPPLQILIINMLSHPHEIAAAWFNYLLLSKSDHILPLGATSAKVSAREKQADSSWRPRPNPPGISPSWPTVALEVAFSESRAKVKRDVSWWLHESNGDVRMVLTIDIKTTSGDIYINSWDRGAIMPTRLHPYPEPRAIQEIKLYRNQSPMLDGDDLVIPFDKMMLRKPGPGEGPFIFTKKELQGLAERVWEGMDLYEKSNK